jgi:HAD superfamily hydrolase (TIGR01509 family)
LHFEYIKSTFPVLDAFHNIITSYETGFRKPQSQIYQKTLQILKVSPGETFYTDDRPELVESAARIGIRGFVFQSVEKLKKDLLDTGIKIN